MGLIETIAEPVAHAFLALVVLLFLGRILGAVTLRLGYRASSRFISKVVDGVIDRVYY